MLKGIPEDQWTPHERDYVQMLREQYQQAQRTYLPHPPHRLCSSRPRPTVSAADPGHTRRIATDTQSTSGWTLVS